MARSVLLARREALRLRKLIAARVGWSRQTYFEHRVAEYHRMWQKIAAARGGRFGELARDLWQIEIGQVRVRVLNYQLEFDNPVTLALAANKGVVHRLLSEEGISVPPHALFALDHLEVARRFVALRPLGTVIKPVGGYGGKGVTTHVLRAGEVGRAALLASIYDDQLLVEAMIPGESYRLLVLEGRVIDTVVRRGPRLTGDGTSTVGQLLASENSRRRAANVPPLTVDRDARFALASQRLDLGSRLEAGREVLIKYVASPTGSSSEVRTVYTSPAAELVCDSIRRDAETAARVVGSDFLGVDVITTDPSLPLSATGGVINEVNTTPALHHHYDPEREDYPRAAVLALDALIRRKVRQEVLA